MGATRNFAVDDLEMQLTAEGAARTDEHRAPADVKHAMAEAGGMTATLAPMRRTNCSRQDERDERECLYKEREMAEGSLDSALRPPLPSMPPRGPAAPSP